MRDFLEWYASKSNCIINIITDGAATVQVEDNNAFTEHSKSNVYISAFITAYSRLKLYHEALDKLKSLVLYFDTDSVIYVSPTGEDLIPEDTTGQMGLWTLEADEGDYFTEFVSCGPKTYALKSFSTKKDISKSKGFSLQYNNQRIFNFEGENAPSTQKTSTWKTGIACKRNNYAKKEVPSDGGRKQRKGH